MKPLAPTDPRNAGEFRLSARLGHGGMGQVFLGYSPAGRAVAVKICHPELAADPEFVRRFAREVTAAQAVNGLYTAPVVAAGPYDSPPWLATAYVAGPSLQDLVKRFGPLPEPAVWRLAAGLAEALQAVHDKGLVHRDLKPANVLLAVDGPRVIDFGIASALDSVSMTAPGTAMGSPPYMSPEQALGRAVGPASDVFAFGATVAFAACGAPPFGGGDPAGVLFRVAHTQPALDSLPPALRGMVAACLAKEPGARPGLPRLLRACEASLAGSGAQGGGSAASFWPGQVTAAISGYQAALAADGATDGQRTADRPGAPDGPTAPPRRAGTTLVSALGRRRVLTGLGGLAVAGGLAAAGVALTRSGGGTAAGTLADSSAANAARTAWVQPVGGPVRSAPVLSGGILYVGSDDGTVYALDAASGRKVTSYPVGSAVSGGVAVSSGTLFAGGADGTVHALPFGGGGAAPWTAHTGASVATVPAVDAGVVYIGSDDGYVYAFDAGTGARKWRSARTGGPVRSGPVVAQPDVGVVWAGSTDGHMYALNAGSGAVEWRFPAGGALRSGPVAVSGSVYFGGDNGTVYDLQLSPVGDVKNVPWHASVGGAVRGTPAVADEILFAGSAKTGVYALDLNSGDRIWTVPTARPVLSGPASVGGVVYAGADDGSLYAIDISAGAARWRYQAKGAIRSRVVAGGGLVYFGTQRNRVYAVHA